MPSPVLAMGYSRREMSASTTIEARSVTARRRVSWGWPLWLGLLLLALVGLIDILVIRYVADLAERPAVEVISDRPGAATERERLHSPDGGALTDRSRALRPRPAAPPKEAGSP